MIFFYLTLGAIIYLVNPSRSIKSNLILGIILVITSHFLYIDTIWIVYNKYSDMFVEEDYIYGSIKLFVDMLAIWGVIISILNGNED